MVYIYTTPILYPKSLIFKALYIRLFKLNIMYVYDTGIIRSLIINLHCIVTYPRG